MGFMGITSIGESDNASDFINELVLPIREKIQTHMQEQDNQYNTPNYINCTLVLKSLISEDNEFYFIYKDDWIDIYTHLKNNFDNNPEKWNNSDLKKGYKVLHDFINDLYNKCLNN